MIPIRKSVNDLTPADLEQFPVWQFALDEEGEEDQDETTVKPISFADAEWDGSTLIKIDFTLADGRRFVGHATPLITAAGAFAFEHPEIITETDQVSFWYGASKPSMEELARCYRILGSDAEGAFPITFSPALGMAAGHDANTVEGFSYLIDYSGPTETIK